MKRITLFLLSLLFLARCSDSSEEEPENLLLRDLFVQVPQGFRAEIISQELQLPTSIAFPPDGTDRLFVNELQTGRVRIIENGVLLTQPFVEVETNVNGGFPVDGENGLIGLAFDPDFVDTRWVYITFAVRNEQGVNEGIVARMRDNGNVAVDFEVIFDGLPSERGHQVQSLTFGPDGMLYVYVSDAFQEEFVQDLNAFQGKILRMNPDGSLPGDNPFGADSYIYALGFRNNFDMVFRDNGDLLTTENGPNFNDEFNVVLPGQNYGWPNALGISAEPQFTNPIFVWDQIVAPTGMLFYEGDNFPEQFRGQLFQVLFGDTFSQESSDISKRIQTSTVTGSGASTTVSFEDFAVYTLDQVGNPLDIAVGPNGFLYYTDIFRGGVYRIRYIGE